MAGQVDFFNRLLIGFGTLWGFDSFEGLPDLDSQEVHEVGSIGDWRSGGFSAADALGVHNYPALVENMCVGRGSNPTQRTQCGIQLLFKLLVPGSPAPSWLMLGEPTPFQLIIHATRGPLHAD